MKLGELDPKLDIGPSDSQKSGGISQIDVKNIVKKQDISNLSQEQIKSQLAHYGISMKNKTNKKLYERLLLEIYTYSVKNKLPSYL